MSLLVRLTDVESEAALPEREVRDNPGLTVIAPDVAAESVSEAPAPEVVPDRPRMTVERRAAPGAPASTVRSASGVPTVATAPEGMWAGLVSRLVPSHRWWRIGIVLVSVGRVLRKFGWHARDP